MKKGKKQGRTHRSDRNKAAKQAVEQAALAVFSREMIGLRERIEALEEKAHEGAVDASSIIYAIEPPVRITPDQAKSMSDIGGWLMGWDSSNGWLLIGNLDSDPDDSGNGCWHNESGDEIHP